MHDEREPDLHGSLERPSRARQPSRRTLTPRAPETVSTNATDSPIPLCSGMGRTLMLADASSSRRCARSTSDTDERVSRAARRCRRRPMGRAAEPGPRGASFTGRARTTYRHPERRHNLKRMILQRVGASRSTAPRLAEDLTDVCTEPLYRRSAPPHTPASTGRYAFGPEHRNQVGASARYVRPAGVAERAPTGQSVRVRDCRRDLGRGSASASRSRRSGAVLVRRSGTIVLGYRDRPQCCGVSGLTALPQLLSSAADVRDPSGLAQVTHSSRG